MVGVVDSDGVVLQRLRYDVWGQRIDPDNSEILAQLTLTSPLHTRFTPRGYTGHEMLDAHGLIHMNGRIYDPKLGRFLQADPIIQFPHSTQGQNRYSYVLNNPLTYTDPSGYFIGKLLRKVVGGIINGIFGEVLFSKVPVLRQFSTLAHCLSGNALTCATAAAGNAYAGGVSLQRVLKAGLFTYVSAQAFSAVGHYFQAIEATGGFTHLGAHALTGGVLAELQGGQFGNGFLAAGLSKSVIGRFSYRDVSAPAVIGRTTIAAVVGGTVSRITGGKFANGALTAAMAQLFNAEASAARAQGSIDETRRTAKSWSDGIKRGLQSIKDKFVPDFGRAGEIGQEVLDTSPGHNNMGDAKRHAVWSQRMYQEINPVTSYTAGYLYELKNLLTRQPLNETLMDLHNNSVGRAAAASGTMIDHSHLIVIDPSEPFIDAVTQY